MRSILFWLVALLALCALSSARAAAVVTLASDDWCPFICSGPGGIDGGFLVELAQQALATQRYRVDSKLMPLSRAMAMSESGELDGVYAPPVDDTLLQSKPLAYSRACFYTPKQSHWRYAGLSSLRGLKIGAIVDYGYDGGEFDRLLAAKGHGGLTLDFNTGEKAGNKNLRKLLLGRYPVLLEHEAVMAHIESAVPGGGQVREAGCLERPLPLVIGFGRHGESGVEMARALDAGMARLSASGQLEKLKRKYRIK
ncbi:substrate-binding periplasmic protein [Chromobacterium alticapitis]|uniref:ABC transporter substrate-binding protein n=1 Tax=Chromobacterium alticapitis TaxID=2073169 RepID=A0A2S5DFT7_9NEIS|nr:transporter substrate-binding domain-containing protein [Chromobacterium alticapitis]POZ61889.1 ABC transporter substrate-binding protein [Chromobacterium alticapitis]